MNQRGEITLLSCCLILTLMGIVLICGLELNHSYMKLQKRTHFYLCVKETKGELHHFMKFMGRTNWGIKNINRAALIMLFIPGLQGAAMNADKLKKYLQYVQEAMVLSYLKSLKDLKGKNCPVDPRMFITPFEPGLRLLKRDSEGAARLRETEWTYFYFSKPYLVSLKVNASGFEKIKPKVIYQSEEKGAKYFSHLSSRY